jgi:hypothetical protein
LGKARQHSITGELEVTIGRISAATAGTVIAMALLAPAASAQVATTSPFALACLSSGGTAGRVGVRSGSSRLRLYSGTTTARLSLSFSSTSDVSSINLAIAGQPAGEPTSLTMRPGEGRFLFASRLEIDGLGGTVGKEVDYCLRAN